MDHPATSSSLNLQAQHRYAHISIVEYTSFANGCLLDLFVNALKDLLRRSTSLIWVLSNEQQVDVALLDPKAGGEGTDNLNYKSLRSDDFFELGQPNLHFFVGQLILLYALTLYLVDFLSEPFESFSLFQEHCLFLHLDNSLISIKNGSCFLEHSRHILLIIERKQGFHAHLFLFGLADLTLNCLQFLYCFFRIVVYSFLLFIATGAVAAMD